jgi:hypothetical protein
MRQAEPSAQLMRGLVGCSPVKGHQRPGAAGHAGNLRTPLIVSNERHFDMVFTAIDGFLEAMNGERHAMRYEADTVKRVANPGSILGVR